MANIHHLHSRSVPWAYEEESPSPTSSPIDQTSAPSLNLMALWLRHKSECRSISLILKDARAGKLPGITAGPLSDQYQITDTSAALAAMRKETQS